MPRTARASVGGMCYHVLNRGNGRADVFHKDGDYAAFLDLMVEANERLPVRVLGYVLLPNHFHLVLWPRGGGDLSRWMQWLMTSHVRRYHRHYKGSGHVWQGRFKAFPIEQDEHLLTVLRYVERNPLRAKLVRRAEDWEWSSLAWRRRGRRPALLSPWPVPCPRNWVAHINTPQTDAELAALGKKTGQNDLTNNSSDPFSPFLDKRSPSISLVPRPYFCIHSASCAVLRGAARVVGCGAGVHEKRSARPFPPAKVSRNAKVEPAAVLRFVERGLYGIIPCMISISFPDSATETAALGFLAGRCSFKSFDNGTTLVPEAVLGLLAAEGIRFTVSGKAVYEQVVPTIRDPAPSQVQ